VVIALSQTDGGQRVHRPLVPLGGLELQGAVIQQRQFHVVERGGARQQVEPLEHEADLLVADRREVVFRHPGHVLAIEKVVPAGRTVETAEDVHQRGLAGARRTGDGHELTVFDVEVRTAQCADGDLADDIGLDEVPDRDHWCHWCCL
jgi:hypothetical protein